MDVNILDAETHCTYQSTKLHDKPFSRETETMGCASLFTSRSSLSFAVAAGSEVSIVSSSSCECSKPLQEAIFLDKAQLRGDTSQDSSHHSPNSHRTMFKIQLKYLKKWGYCLEGPSMVRFPEMFRSHFQRNPFLLASVDRQAAGKAPWPVIFATFCRGALSYIKMISTKTFRWCHGMRVGPWTGIVWTRCALGIW